MLTQKNALTLVLEKEDSNQVITGILKNLTLSVVIYHHTGILSHG